MSCCGKNRALAQAAALAGGASAVSSGARPASGGRTDVETSVVMFESVGRDPIVIHGPSTGRVYRFRGAGDRVRVDARDRPGLAAMTSLRWVR